MFDLSPRRNPSLPQNDSALEQKLRDLQLAFAQGAYRWTDTMPNVVGVPMATKVPWSDQPSLEWLLQVGEVGLQIVENQLAVKFSDYADDADAKVAAQQGLQSLRQNLAELRSAHDVSLRDNRDDLLHGVSAAVSHLLSLHHEAILDALQQLQKLIREQPLTSADMVAAGDGLAPYDALFKTLPLPPIASSFEHDGTFARLRVAGPNPMLITGVMALPAKFPLTEAQYQQVMGADDSLLLAGQEQRLYMLDYAELNSLVAQPGTTDGLPKFVYAPLALFAIPKAGGALTPVAIQCGQDSATFPMFLQASSDQPAAYWGWQMAKTIVQVAEGNYHELFVHLARTHLVIEAFTVATHRQLASRHPINVLLLPHFEGTLFINNSAADSLIAPGGPIDEIFGAVIQATQQAAGGDRLAFGFYANMLPAELAARNVANPAQLPDYPYRDDGLLVWQAIAQWTTEYVRVYYANDGAVVGDTELAAWTAELMGDGKIKGFRPIASREQLAEVLTMIIFTASAQHAAVNFPQKPIMTYAPAITGAGWAAVPTQQTGQSQPDWLKLMPPISAAMEQLNVLYLLGSVHYRHLGEYRSNVFPYAPWFEDKQITEPGGPLARFNANLHAVEETINARNRERPEPYSFLLPSLIPPSINI